MFSRNCARNWLLSLHQRSEQLITGREFSKQPSSRKKWMCRLAFRIGETGGVQTLLLSKIDKLPTCRRSFPCSWLFNISTEMPSTELSKTDPGHIQYREQLGYPEDTLNVLWVCRTMFLEVIYSGLDGATKASLQYQRKWQCWNPALRHFISLNSNSWMVCMKMDSFLVYMKYLEPRKIWLGEYGSEGVGPSSIR